MCQYFQKIKTTTKFVILMHPKEFKKVKNNTGHFTHQSLPNSELFVGIDFTNHKRINEIIQTHQSYILYPSEDALNISTTVPPQSQQPLAIFLIDATWACAKPIFYRSTNLAKLPHMSFSATRNSAYEIKIQPQDGYLSTIESAQEVLYALAKHKIENITKEEIESFLEPFYKMIAYQKELIANPKSHAVRFKRRR
jgi:DTW domain-containing protein YfiP